MTDKTVDATPYNKLHWEAIDWRQAERVVRRLQTRIVKALKRNAFRKVKDLQRLLTKSLSARLLAVRRVTTNKGSKTPGVDGTTWKTSGEKVQAVHDLGGDIDILPLRRIYIPKKNGKKRPISIPTMLNRAQQACYLMALDPIAETNADEHSYGFRLKRSAHDAIGYIHHVLRRKGSPQWILEADIKSCFDEISHSWLKDNIPMDKSLLQKWLKSGFIEKNTLYPTEGGAPQGGIASPTLANMTLNGLEKMIKEKFGDKPGQKTRNKVHLCRYADDFIVTAESEELLEEKVLPAIKDFLMQRGLQISEDKTRITHISEGFDFLGQHTRKYKGKALTMPSKKAIEAIKEKLGETIRTHRVDATSLIMKINPIIKGWCNYHRYIVSRKAFEEIDHHVFMLLWKWAKKQHPTKSKRWIVKKYFDRDRAWVFTATAERRKVEQYLASSTKIRRHILIKGKANPYDEEYDEYFEKRTRRTTVRCVA